MPIVYGFSPNLLPRPEDWGEWLQVSGHWFSEVPPTWQPPQELQKFLEAGKPPLYVGFGSMVDEQIKRATPMLLSALQQTGQRAILSGGWGGLGAGDLPETILRIGSVPHEWLFPHVSAVVHHGGAGTTATGLRHGKPSVIVPFFADQPFWGRRVYQLGVGPKPVAFTRLTTGKLTQAIDKAVNDPGMRIKAENLGQKLQAEDGVGKAVGFIKHFLEKKAGVRSQIS